MTPVTPTDPKGMGYQLCLDELTRRIRVGILQPGEQIRQDRIASELSVSRTPLRQALQSLTVDGLLILVPNAGFFVARLTVEELSEIYWMREVLETRLYETLVFDGLDIAHLWETERQLEAAIEARDMHDVGLLTRELQFEIFAASPLATVRDFVSRLWLRCESYRAMQRVVYLADATSRAKRQEEHRRVIEALERRDRAAAIQMVALRRNNTIDIIKVVLSARAEQTRRGRAGPAVRAVKAPVEVGGTGTVVTDKHGPRPGPARQDDDSERR